MKAFANFTGLAAPLPFSDVDTDQIIPKQFLKSVKRTGFGVHLFDEWRYLDEGVFGQDCSKRPLNPDFILNKPQYQGASILLAGRNFGCGSSREHAPWALAEYGFKVVIAPSFADIFYNNCFKNGLLPIQLPEVQVNELLEKSQTESGLRLGVDLVELSLTDADSGQVTAFQLDAFRQKTLLEGLDEIARTLAAKADIQAFEAQHFSRFPWLKVSF
jgi:3-isopropylmalate/(R)-2-methylmalate dehydratase small subunit